MLIGLLSAFAAALAYGAATILQAIGVRRLAAAEPHWRARARAGWPYAAGLGLDLVGFAVSVIALRTLPLFLVESAVASSVAVTAVLSVLVLGVRLTLRDFPTPTAAGGGWCEGRRGQTPARTPDSVARHRWPAGRTRTPGRTAADRGLWVWRMLWVWWVSWGHWAGGSKQAAAARRGSCALRIHC